MRNDMRAEVNCYVAHDRYGLGGRAGTQVSYIVLGLGTHLLRTPTAIDWLAIY